MAGGISIVDGLLTWGAPAGASVDPAWTEQATPTLAGGTIGRPITRTGGGRWLLDLDLGGELLRFGTRETEVVSRQRGGSVRYVPGLDDLQWEIDGESGSVLLRAGSSNTWALLRRKLGPIRGRRVVLRYWHRTQVLEDAYVALQGVVGTAAYGDPGDPFSLQLSLQRDLRALSKEMLQPTAKVDYNTFSGILGDVPEEGIPYPLVLGCPGAARAGGLVTPATPGLPINYTLTRRILIAGHRVEATRVWVFNITQGEVVDLPVEHGLDDLGQEFAYVDLLGVPIFDFNAEEEYAVGWDRTWGGGLLHRGRAVQGLGDLLQWGADVYSLAIYDQGEMSARRSALNRFRVDTVVNEQILWSDWLESNVLSLFELEEVQGPRGLYYEEIRHEAHRRHVRARLTTDQGQGGHFVSRVSQIAEEDEEIINSVRIAYLPFAASHTQFVETVTVQPPRTGLVVEDVVLSSPRCAYSERLFGPREATWETAITSDTATATAVAHTKVARHAIPKLLVTYEGGRGLLDLRKHQVVEIYDARGGAAFEGDLAIVRGLQIVDGATVRVTLAVDSNPLTNPTVSG